jgi:hypothetical protein
VKSTRTSLGSTTVAATSVRSASATPTRKDPRRGRAWRDASAEAAGEARQLDGGRLSGFTPASPPRSAPDQRRQRRLPSSVIGKSAVCIRPVDGLRERQRQSSSLRVIPQLGQGRQHVDSRSMATATLVPWNAKLNFHLGMRSASQRTNCLGHDRSGTLRDRGIKYTDFEDLRNGGPLPADPAKWRASGKRVSAEAGWCCRAEIPRCAGYAWDSGLGAEWSRARLVLLNADSSQS